MFNQLLPLRWRSVQSFSRSYLSDNCPAFFLERGSLTAQLRTTCRQDFRVRLISQSRRRLHFDESSLLKMAAREWAMVREVELICDDQVKVTARSVIPDLTLKGKGRALRVLGTKALIEILSRDPQLRRSHFELAHHRHDECFKWSRRSIFKFYGRPLLVMERFT